MRSKSAGLDFWSSNVEVLLEISQFFLWNNWPGLDLKELQKRALLNHISARPNRNFFRALRTLRDDAHANFGACVRRKQGLADRCLKADRCTFLQIPAVFRFGGQKLGVPKLWRAYQKQHTDFHNTTSHDMLYSAISSTCVNFAAHFWRRRCSCDASRQHAKTSQKDCTIGFVWRSCTPLHPLIKHWPP